MSMYPTINFKSLFLLLSFTLTLSLEIFAQGNSPAEIRRRRLESIRELYNVAAKEPGVIGDLIAEIKSREGEILFNQEKPIPNSVRESRSIIGTLFKNPELRKLAVASLDAELTALTNKNKETILKQNRQNKKVVVNQIVVGMGVQGAAYAQEATNKSPDQIILQIDRAKRAGGTFAEIFYTFFINSTNRKYTGDRARPGIGDLNNFNDIIGVPDFAGKRWFPAGLLGQAVPPAVYLSNTIPMLETEILDIKRSNSGKAKYKVTLKVNGSETVTVYTNKVVFTSGLGTPTLFGDKSTRSLITRERNNAKKQKRTSRIESFTEFFERVGNPEVLFPRADLINKTVLVIGGGDSGRVIAEYLTGLGPEEGYKQSVAQEGNIKRIFWFVGTSAAGFRDCKEYIAKTRARYSQIAQALNSGILIPVTGKINGIRSANGGYQITDFEFLDKNGNIDKRSREIEYILPKDLRKGRKRAKTVMEVVTFDKIIYATGFKNNLGTVLRNLIPRGVKLQNAFNFVTKKLKAFGNASVNIARELKFAEGIFLAGSANEAFGGLPLKSELVGVNANTVSIFANNARTQALARYNSKDVISINDSRLAQKLFQESLNPQKIALKIKYSKGKTVSVNIITNKKDFAKIERVVNAEFALRASLAISLSKIAEMKHLKGKKLKLVFRPIKAGNGFVFQIEHASMSRTSLNQLRGILNSNTLLQSVVMRDYFKEKGNKLNIEKINVHVSVNSKGKLNLSTLRTKMIRRR